MRTVRNSFVKNFGEEEARKIELSAGEHQNGVNSETKGKDPFKWALLICIGYECFIKKGYRKYHGFKVSHKRIKEWILEHGKLHTYVGDCDYLALAAGAYHAYLKKEE